MTVAMVSFYFAEQEVDFGNRNRVMGLRTVQTLGNLILIIQILLRSS
jgi:hypothetical protein